MPPQKLFFRGCLVLVAISGAVHAEDWPQWGGHDDRNMVSQEKNLPASFVPGRKKPDGTGIDLGTTKNVRWVARLGSETYGNATVANGRVFIGTNDFGLDDPRYASTEGGLLKCLDAATGQQLWKLVVPRYETTDPNFNFDNLNLGVCGSPTVDGDRVYVVTNRCDVLCLSVHGLSKGNHGYFRSEGQYIVGPGKRPIAPGPGDADILWQYDMIKNLPSWPQDAACSSPLVHGDFVYVGTSNGVDRSNEHVPHPLAPSLIVLNKHNGRLVANDVEAIGKRLFHGQWSSPSLGKVGDKTLVFFGAGDGICYAFQTVEKMTDQAQALVKVWSFDCNPPEYRFRDGKPIHYRAGDSRRQAGNNNDGAYVGPSEIIATPTFYKNRVYVTIGQDPVHGRGKGMLSCIDATKIGDISKTGKIWTYDKIGRSLSTVSIADGLLYVAELTGRMHCLDADTGKCHWTHDTKAEVWGSTLVADGKVYLGTEKGFWVLAAGKEKRVLGEMKLGSPAWCTPVAANGMLYVSSQRYLWAVQATATTPSPAKPVNTRHLTDN